MIIINVQRIIYFCNSLSFVIEKIDGVLTAPYCILTKNSPFYSAIDSARIVTEAKVNFSSGTTFDQVQIGRYFQISNSRTSNSPEAVVGDF